MSDLQKLMDYIGAPQEIFLSDEIFRDFSLFWRETKRLFYSRGDGSIVELTLGSDLTLTSVQIHKDSVAVDVYQRWGYLIDSQLKPRILNVFMAKQNIFESLANQFQTRFLELKHVETSKPKVDQWRFTFRAGGLVEILTSLDFEIQTFEIYEGSSALERLAQYLPIPGDGYNKSPKILRFDNFKTAVTHISGLGYRLVRFKIDQSFDPMRYWFECVGNSSVSYLVAEISNTANAG